MNLSRFLVPLLLIISVVQASGQSTVQTEKENIITEARKQLVQMSEPAGELSEFVMKNGIKGEYVVDFTIAGKGQIITIFMVSSTSETIQMQNLLKSKLTELEFANIKVPKKERIKFRHTLTF